MPGFKILSVLALTASLLQGAAAVGVETRTLDQIYAAALKEGGVVNLWHGGDEPGQQDALKAAFEARFPGMTLNVTVDLSKYHDGKIDQQIAGKNVYIDSVMLQTVHDFPRWKSQGALLNYKPLGFNEIYPQFKDKDGYFNGVALFAWSNVWTPAAVSAPIIEYTDYLRPELKDKIVLTYPNDDDAVLWQFDLIIKKYGWKWFDSLLLQNPRWVRGTATPVSVIGSSNGKYVATFTTTIGLVPFTPFNISFPTQSNFVSWPQQGAILKNAPHPESAKLLNSWKISLEVQNNGWWSVRQDANKPANFPVISKMPNTNPAEFWSFMADRASVERLRFLIEDKIGTAQGLSPLKDDL